jgi:hypothetical protein
MRRQWIEDVTGHSECINQRAREGDETYYVSVALKSFPHYISSFSGLLRRDWGKSSMEK